MNKIEIFDYHYTECGLDYIWLGNGVFEIDGPYGRATSISDLDDLHQIIGLSIIQKKKTFQGQEIKFLRHEMDMSQNMIAQLLGSNEQTFSRWERDECKMPGPAQRLLSVIYWQSVNGESHVKDVLLHIADFDAELHNRKLKLELLEEKWQTAA